MRSSLAAIALLLFVAGCSGPPPELPEGPFVGAAGALSSEWGVPRDLVLALALQRGSALPVADETRRLGELGARFGARSGDLASWRPAVRALAGLSSDERERFVTAVFDRLRDGTELRAPSGEAVRLAPHPELAN
jgi:hypothetical protein